MAQMRIKTKEERDNQVETFEVGVLVERCERALDSSYPLKASKMLQITNLETALRIVECL